MGDYRCFLIGHNRPTRSAPTEALISSVTWVFRLERVLLGVGQAVEPLAGRLTAEYYRQRVGGGVERANALKIGKISIEAPDKGRIRDARTATAAIAVAQGRFQPWTPSSAASSLFCGIHFTSSDAG